MEGKFVVSGTSTHAHDVATVVARPEHIRALGLHAAATLITLCSQRPVRSPTGAAEELLKEKNPSYDGSSMFDLADFVYALVEAQLFSGLPRLFESREQVQIVADALEEFEKWKQLLMRISFFFNEQDYAGLNDQLLALFERPHTMATV